MDFNDSYYSKSGIYCSKENLYFLSPPTKPTQSFKKEPLSARKDPILDAFARAMAWMVGGMLYAAAGTAGMLLTGAILLPALAIAIPSILIGTAFGAAIGAAKAAARSFSHREDLLNAKEGGMVGAIHGATAGFALPAIIYALAETAISQLKFLPFYSLGYLGSSLLNYAKGGNWMEMKNSGTGKVDSVGGHFFEKLQVITFPIQSIINGLEFKDISYTNFVDEALKRVRLNDGRLSLKEYGFGSPDAAVAYVIEHNLSCANFAGFDEIDTNHIIKLAVSCKNLRSINFSYCSNFSDQWLDYLSILPLERVDLSGCDQLTDEGLKSLEKMNIKSLDLSGCCAVTDEGISYINTKSLKFLSLSGCINMTEKGLCDLKECISLKHLDLSGCLNIGDYGLRHLKNLPLKFLDLSLCYDITDEGLKCLKKMPLKHLGLSSCKYITNVGLACMERAKLIFLDLSFCVNIDDAALKCLSGMNLKYLDLSCCHISDKGLKYIGKLKKRKNLTSLSLSGCNNLTGSGLKYLQKFPLTLLDLSDCYNLASQELAHLAPLPLTKLDISGCNLNDDLFKYISNLSVNDLDLSGNSITDAGLKSVKNSILASQLYHLNLEACFNLSEDCAEFLDL